MSQPTHSFARYRTYAFICAFLLLACVLISRPVAEVGINDDFSYIRSAKLMAETGHIRYVGWASAMLGWMLPLGAVFIKLFGFSFTVVRAANTFVAVLTAFLIQRCLVRSGLNERNGTIVTLMLVLSPLYLPLAATFLTDIPGMAITLLCFYGCLRALQAASDRRAFAWIAFACITNALGGTARQTAWLGVMVMVPSAFWLLRKRRLPWVGCGILWVGSLLFIYASLRWFVHQPYSLQESLVGGYVDRDLAYALVEHVTRAILETCFLLLPLLIAFLPHVSFRDSRARRWMTMSSAGVAVFALWLVFTHNFVAWLAPFVGNTFTDKGIFDLPEVGVRQVMLQPWLRAFLTLLTLWSAIATVAYLLSSRGEQSKSPARQQDRPVSNWRNLAILLGPYAVVYIALLLHRAVFDYIFDRYLLTLLFIVALFLARTYQEHLAPNLPASSVALIVLVALFSVAANHDLFSMERARITAANELLAAGIAPTRFYGGWEYDGWTQIDHYGFVNSGNINMPQGFSARAPVLLRMTEKPCHYSWARLFPAVQPEYALSFDDVSCGGPAGLPPVAYRSWLPPYRAKIYIVRVMERIY